MIIIQCSECSRMFHIPGVIDKHDDEFRVVRKHEIKHEFETVQFIWTIAALKARNNHISNQSLSETAQILARSFENYILALSVIAMPSYMIKRTKLQCTHQFASLRRAWENKSAMSTMWLTFRDRSHS